MFGFGKPKGLVGLDIGSSSVKVVELRKKGDSYELVNMGMEGLGQDAVVDGQIMDSFTVTTAIETIFNQNKIKQKNVATAVSGHSVIVKKISVNAPSELEVANAIPYEAPQYIPFAMEDVNISYQVLGPALAGPGFEVMLVAVKRDKILNHTNVLSQAGKTPMVVDIDAFALQNAFEVNYEPPPDRMIALLNIGASLMNINIMRGGVPLFTRDVSVGGNQYTDTLQKELDLSFDDAERLKAGQPVGEVTLEQASPHIRSVSEILLLEVQKTFDFFRQTTSAESIQQIYVGGGSARIEGLVDLLKEEFGIPVEIMNPFQRVECNPAKFPPDQIEALGPRMCVAVGLALRSFDTP
jgi:type IV pilus assembly protein PilM